MGVFDLLRPWHSAIKRVSRAMDEVLARAERRGPCCVQRQLDLDSDRYIILSDLHRGTRNASDDFRNNEQAYSAALAYYFRMGHTLVLLGDVEELWKERPESVLSSYSHTIELEARFHQQGRYLRIWGNHDDDWQFEDRVEDLLAPRYGNPPLRVYEALLLPVSNGENELGRLLCVHGHQGDRRSDQWSWFARYLIRYLWRPIQRITKISKNTPAKDWYLEDRLHRAMYTWAERQPDLVLITGHVHTPVFESRSREALIAAELAQLQERVGDRPTPAQVEAQARTLARLEWVRAEERERRRRHNGVAFEKPYYFGTGCCCYSDGHITGIEIDRGEIRLIRWPNERGEPRPHILARDSLRRVLRA